MGSATQKKILHSGVSPLELVRYSVLSYADGTEQGIYTELHVNNPEMGTLTPSQYRAIADKSNQGMRLSACALRRVADFLSENKESRGWVSFYMPARAVVYNHLRKMLESERNTESYDLSRLVVEIPYEILYEDPKQISETMTKLKEEFGVRFMLSGYCDEYCPVLRLPQYPVDFVLLDSTFDTPNSFKTMLGAINIAKQSGKTVIARLSKPLYGLTREEAPNLYIPDIPVYEGREV